MSAGGAAWALEDWDRYSRTAPAAYGGPVVLRAKWDSVGRGDGATVGGGTLLRDVVRYRLPLGRVGSAVAGWKVERDVDRIFDYRATHIAQRFAA